MEDGAPARSRRPSGRPIRCRVVAGEAPSARGSGLPSSPDLNPIENIWSLLKQRVEVRARVKLPCAAGGSDVCTHRHP